MQNEKNVGIEKHRNMIIRIEKHKNFIGKIVWMNHRKNIGNIRRYLVLKR